MGSAYVCWRQEGDFLRLGLGHISITFVGSHLNENATHCRKAQATGAGSPQKPGAAASQRASTHHHMREEVDTEGRRSAGRQVIIILR